MKQKKRRKQEGNFGKSASRQKFSRKILWIENLAAMFAVLKHSG